MNPIFKVNNRFLSPIYMSNSEMNSQALFTVKSDNSGRKVCASQALPAGTELCQFSGIPITYGDTLKLGSQESFALQTDKDLYLYLDEPYRYFNHSCDPNCGLSPQQKLICLRDIDKGEELRYDYSTTMMERHWTLKCKCNTALCRHTVGDFDSLPEKTREFYIRQNIVQAFIVKALYSKIQKSFGRSKPTFTGARPSMRRSPR